jgi:hypothetical protein
LTRTRRAGARPARLKDARRQATGTGASSVGEVRFLDRGGFGIDGRVYCRLKIVDAASNPVWAEGDSFFAEPESARRRDYRIIKPIALGPNALLPNRAEAAVNLFKHHAQILLN